MKTWPHTKTVIHETPVWSEFDRAWEIGRFGYTRVMIFRFVYTTAILTMTPETGWDPWYADRWCFEEFETAVIAALAWLHDGGDEPDGWVRHPDSGRYRPGGDPTREEVYF